MRLARNDGGDADRLQCRRNQPVRESVYPHSGSDIRYLDTRYREIDMDKNEPKSKETTGTTNNSSKPSVWAWREKSADWFPQKKSKEKETGN